MVEKAITAYILGIENIKPGDIFRVNRIKYCVGESNVVYLDPVNEIIERINIELDSIKEKLDKLDKALEE